MMGLSHPVNPQTDHELTQKGFSDYFFGIMIAIYSAIGLAIVAVISRRLRAVHHSVFMWT